jgi:hypothetical protein
VRGYGERGDVADVHGGVAGRLQPEQLRAFEQGGLGVSGGGGEADLNAEWNEDVLQQGARTEVAVGRHDYNVSGHQHGAEDGGDGRHP